MIYHKRTCRGHTENKLDQIMYQFFSKYRFKNENSSKFQNCRGFEVFTINDNDASQGKCPGSTLLNKF